MKAQEDYVSDTWIVNTPWPVSEATPSSDAPMA